MNEPIIRKKMYKAGKNWVVASVATVALLAGSSSALADQNTTDTTSDVSQETTTAVDNDMATQVKSANGLTQNEVTLKSSTKAAEENTTAENTTAENTATQQTEVKEDTQVAKNTVTQTTDATKTPVQASSADTTVQTQTKASDVQTTLDSSSAVAPQASSAKESTATKEDTKQVATKEEQPATTQATTAQTTDNNGLNETAAKIAKEANLDVSKLTEAQVKALNRIVVDDARPAGTRMTYKNFEDIANTLVKQDPAYAIPYFNASKIKNMPAAYARSAQTGEFADLDIWDSWPVQDAKTGLVSNWNGYQLVVAMMGVPGQNDSHLYLLYNKYGDNKFENWKNAGSIFGYNETPARQHWSGSTTVNSDGTLQLYYTLVDTTDNGTNHQKIASAVLTLDHDENDVSIKSVDNDHVIFEGDGYYYQTYDQWKATNRGADNIAMRDAHIIETENGDRYLIFESSTGLQNYQGEDQIYNWKNYGGDASYNTKSLFSILNNDDMTSRASWANASIGILKLNNNEKYPEVEKVYAPLLTANMVSDEIERPSVIKLGNKYYLFAATRLNRGSNDTAWMNANYAVGDNVAMVGYVSDELTGGYKPLNGSGVVLTASVPANWRTATYSYYAIPVEGYNDRVLITAYMTNRGNVAGEGMNSTLAPSFLVQINPDGTTKVLNKFTAQGDWIWDDSSEDPDMAGTLDTAALPGERDKPVDWDLIGYGLRDHTPVGPNNDDPNNNDPKEPNTPSNPQIPENPADPKTPVIDDPGVSSKPDSNLPKVVKSSSLPQTGDAKSPVAMVVAGLSAILASFGLARTKKRQK